MTVTLLMVAFAQGVAGSVAPTDPNRISSMSDQELRQAIDTLKAGEYRKLRDEFLEVSERMKAITKIPTKENFSQANLAEARRINQEYEAKRQALMPVENMLNLLQQEWDGRASTPEDVKEYDRLLAYRAEQYGKGVGTREEMVAKLKNFASKYPDSPLHLRALFDAAMLYTSGRIRDTGEGPYLPEEARELHAQIVAEHPDLLVEFVVWSRHELACLHPTADARFQGRLEFYKWLKDIRPEQCSATVEWMRREHRFRNTTESELKDRIGGLLKGTIDSVKANITYDAKASSNPVENMRLWEGVLQAEPPVAVDSVRQSVKVSKERDHTDADLKLSVKPQLGEARTPLLGVSSVICLSVAGAIAVSVLGFMVVPRIIRKR